MDPYLQNPDPVGQIIQDAIVKALKDAAGLTRSEILGDKATFQVESFDYSLATTIVVRVPVVLRFR